MLDAVILILLLLPAGILVLFAFFLALVGIYDVFIQKNHAILHNYPVVGHLRYILERFGPELRQYIVTNNDEERPFTRDQRRWIYSSSKQQNNLFGFGTDNDLESSDNYLIIQHATFPWAGPDFEGPHHPLP